MAKAREYLTIAQIAEALNEPRHRVVYALQKNTIPHAVRVGNIYGYAPDAVAIVRERLEIDRRFSSFRASNSLH